MGRTGYKLQRKRAKEKFTVYLLSFPCVMLLVKTTQRQTQKEKKRKKCQKFSPQDVKCHVCHAHLSNREGRSGGMWARVTVDTPPFTLETAIKHACAVSSKRIKIFCKDL